MRRHAASGCLHRVVCCTATGHQCGDRGTAPTWCPVVTALRCASSQWGKAPSGGRTGFPASGGGGGGGQQRQQRHPGGNAGRRDPQRHHGNHQSSSQRQPHHNASPSSSSDLFTGNDAPATLEERLQRRFGMHAKLVVREQHTNHPSSPQVAEEQQPHPQGGGEDAPGPPQPPPQNAFKANVTFKQLGFPVEVASVQAATFEAAQERAFALAMESNVVLITPNLQRNGHQGGGEALARLLEVKHVVDELRAMCQTLGRILKFSVKPKLQQQKKVALPPAEAAAATPSEGRHSPTPEEAVRQPSEQQQAVYGCRAYVRDDWAVTANLSFLLEAKSFSPNDALIQAFTAIRDAYRAELSSDDYVKNEFLEAERLLKTKGKSVIAAVAVNGASNGGVERSSSSADVRARTSHGGVGSTVTRPSSVDEDESGAVSSELGGDNAAQQQQGDVYGIVATVTEASGNTYTVRATGQPSLVDAYRAVAQLLFHAEAVHANGTSIVEHAASKPLLLKLRYQCEGMAYHIVEAGLCSEARKPLSGEVSSASLSVAARAAALVRVQIDEVAPLSGILAAPKGEQAGAASSTPASDAVVSSKPFKYIGRGYYDGQEVASSEGLGPYRVELDVYLQLLSALLDRFPEIARFHFAHCFPSVEVLERASHHHDHFRLYNHKGKWSCYNVLGTIASTLVADDGRYENDITDLDGGVSGSRTEARITVNDGYRAKRLLARRFDRRNHRGRAFRQAASDAIEFNFPLQHQIASEHEEYGSSGLLDKNDVSRGGKRLRALPREKRVAHVNQLFGVIGCFAEEDYGWDALRVRTRTVAGDATRCVAELEAQVQGERTRRVVAVSPMAASTKAARRLLVYQVCKQYFPKDLENYLKLGRNDAKPPEAMHDDDALCRVYTAGTPFFAQVLAMLDSMQPDLAPFTWRVERMRRERQRPPTAPSLADSGAMTDVGVSLTTEQEPQQHHVDEAHTMVDDDDGSDESLLTPLYLRFKATVYGNNGDVVVAQRLGNEGEGAFAVVRSVLRATTTSYLSGAADARELWREFECSPPPAVASTHDLCHLVFQLSIGGLGGGDGSSRDATSAKQMVAASGQPAMEVLCTLLDEAWWVATVTLPNMGHIAIARAFARSKREAHRGALILAARSNFAKQLRHYSKHHVEVQAFADDVFHEAVLTQPRHDGSDAALSTTAPHPTSTPHSLLKGFFQAAFPAEALVVEHEPQLGGGGFSCRIFRRPAAHAVGVAGSSADTTTAMEVGYGRGMSKRQALQVASLAALELLFEPQLKQHVATDPTFLDATAAV